VRDKPNGKVLGTVGSGVLVKVTESKVDEKGNPWVHVANYETNKEIGWVFRVLVSCF